jgi:hypothetical protein
MRDQIHPLRYGALQREIIEVHAAAVFALHYPVAFGRGRSLGEVYPRPV